MGFSLSRFLLWISEDSVAAHRWICESLSLSQLKCIPMFQMAGALEDGEMSGYTDEWRWDDERIKARRESGEEAQVCVRVCAYVHAPVCARSCTLITSSSYRRQVVISLPLCNHYPLWCPPVLSSSSSSSSSTVLPRSLHLYSHRQSAAMLISSWRPDVWWMCKHCPGTSGRWMRWNIARIPPVTTEATEMYSYVTSHVQLLNEVFLFSLYLYTAF